MDALTGPGFVLIHRGPLPPLRGERARLMEALRIRAIDLAAAGTTDLDGRYEAFLDEHGCEAILVRPDFYLFGGVATVEAAGDLLDALGRAVPGAMRTVMSGATAGAAPALVPG